MLSFTSTDCSRRLYNKGVSFGRDWWVKTLPLMIQGFGGVASIRVRTYSGEDYLVKDVVKTHEGTVTLNVFIGADGEAPIESGSSSYFDFSTKPAHGFYNLTIDFNDIAHVAVIPSTTDTVTRH